MRSAPPRLHLQGITPFPLQLSPEVLDHSLQLPHFRLVHNSHVADHPILVDL